MTWPACSGRGREGGQWRSAAGGGLRATGATRRRGTRATPRGRAAPCPRPGSPWPESKLGRGRDTGPAAGVPASSSRIDASRGDVQSQHSSGSRLFERGTAGPGEQRAQPSTTLPLKFETAHLRGCIISSKARVRLPTARPGAQLRRCRICGPLVDTLSGGDWALPALQARYKFMQQPRSTTAHRADIGGLLHLASHQSADVQVTCSIERIVVGSENPLRARTAALLCSKGEGVTRWSRPLGVG